MGRVEELECRTPNGEEILAIHELPDDVYVVTRSQLYKLILLDTSLTMKPIHVFVPAGHA